MTRYQINLPREQGNEPKPKPPKPNPIDPGMIVVRLAVNQGTDMVIGYGK
jgi:hypothetical protein